MSRRLKVWQLVHALRTEIAAGPRTGAYGATAKGNTLLTTCDIEPGTIRYVVDHNPLKQGHLALGSHIPVAAAERLQSDPVDVLLILAWNIADEVMEQQPWFHRQGGRFPIPIPEPQFVG